VHLTTSAAGSREHAVAIGNWIDYDHTSEAKVWKDGNWHMVTLTRSASEANAYLDGKLMVTQSPPRAIARNALRLSGIDTSHGFAGKMDEVSVFNATLSATDVLALYESRK
jgi:hypothetical protein